MPQWTLFENDFHAIDAVLNDFLDRTNALSVHLVDRSGQLITSAGRTGDFDPTAFASLIAADFTANAELAQLLGEKSADAVVSEGKNRSVHSCMLAGRVISDPIGPQKDPGTPKSNPKDTWIKSEGNDTATSSDPAAEQPTYV